MPSFGPFLLPDSIDKQSEKTTISFKQLFEGFSKMLLYFASLGAVSGSNADGALLSTTTQ
ncbi:MAG TPA: hypothetical protein DEA90_15690 [Opitutae bacterium]|nr:hypothetical protein [Puniceicoccaceae bacterium]HBR95603.1 hypothetical protein [Opitutae bacterium]